MVASHDARERDYLIDLFLQVQHLETTLQTVRIVELLWQPPEMASGALIARRRSSSVVRTRTGVAFRCLPTASRLYMLVHSSR
jgi:hypothetical protein